MTFERGGEYADIRVEVAMAYVQGSLCFDVVTSFPVSFRLSVWCRLHALEGDPDVGGAQLQFIRAIKPLRWFKIARIPDRCFFHGQAATQCPQGRAKRPILACPRARSALFAVGSTRH